MQLEVMKYFLMVADERSISKAAERAHISQSALSQMIQKLESDLEQPLLVRSNRGVFLTPAGEVVRNYASSIISKYEQMLLSLPRTAGGQLQIMISGTHSMAAYSLPCMLYKIKKRFPNSRYGLEAKNTAEIIRDVCEGLTDFGFVDVINDEPERLDYHPMGRERIVLIAPSGSTVPDLIQIQDLFDIELIMCTMNKCTCDRLEEELVTIGKGLRHLNIIFNADTLPAVKSAVTNGYGMAFVPYESIKHELYEKTIRLVTVKDLNLDYDIHMVTRKLKEMPLPARQLRDYLLEVGPTIFC